MQAEEVPPQAEEAPAAQTEHEEAEEIGGLGSLFEEGDADVAALHAEEDDDADLIDSEDEPQPLEDLCVASQQPAAQKATLLVRDAPAH